MNDGTFSVTNNLRDFDDDLVEAVENPMNFQQVANIYLAQPAARFQITETAAALAAEQPEPAALNSSAVQGRGRPPDPDGPDAR